MKKLNGALCALTLLAALPAWAAGGLQVKEPWVREVPPTAQVTAAYMTLENAGDQPVRLVGATSPLYPKVELHQTITRPDGMAGMAAMPVLELPPRGTVQLAPGGYHLMLIGGAPQKEGSQVPITLQLQDGGKVEVQAPVKKGTETPAAMDHSQHMQHMQHMQQHMQQHMMPPGAMPTPPQAPAAAQAPAAGQHQH